MMIQVILIEEQVNKLLIKDAFSLHSNFQRFEAKFTLHHYLTLDIYTTLCLKKPFGEIWIDSMPSSA